MLVSDMFLHVVAQVDIRGISLIPEALYPTHQHILLALSEGICQIQPMFSTSTATKQGSPPESYECTIITASYPASVCLPHGTHTNTLKS